MEMMRRNLGDVERVLRTGREAIAVIENLLALDKPVVSAINGPPSARARCRASGGHLDRGRRRDS